MRSAHDLHILCQVLAALAAERASSVAIERRSGGPDRRGRKCNQSRNPPVIALPAFTSLRRRLTVLYTALFALAFIAVAGVAQVMIRNHAQASVRAELLASDTVFDRLWTMRARALTQSADVLTRDFGFRAAVASGDRPTIASALATLKKRAGVTDVMVVDLDGTVIGGEKTLAKTAAHLPFTLGTQQRSAVVVSTGSVYRLVVSPILAPNEIGWVIFAVKLDASEMRSLERLSSIPLIATILRRDSAGNWRAVDGTVAPDPSIDRLVGGSRLSATLSLPDGQAFAVAKLLAGVGATPDAALLIRYPLGAALAPYRPLQIGIALSGLLGLVLVLFGSNRLARGISRPLVALDAAARALEEGARTEVAVEGADEIGRLAESFNRMSAGIVEREHRIAHLAFHDSLTGLPNRTFLRQALEQAITRVARSNGNVGLLSLDLDGFKGVNDTLGHPVGDVLLQQVANLLMQIAPDALVARLGGDEFALVLTGALEADRLRAVSQAILDALQKPIFADGHQIATATSIGIAIGPEDGHDADTLLKNADLALYRAKQDGRGNYRYFEPALDAVARLRRQLELDLREALVSRQFRLNFQPIVDLKNDRISCFEALLRWHHPTRGLITPADFIPVAEETGLIIAIGEWVMHEACHYAAQWPDNVRIAVNVSPLQFRNTGFPAIVIQALARSGLAPSRLEVEITESVFLEGETSTVALLHHLRAMGVRIALDDFGTGYSSLSYLRSFPFDKIKIDRSFVTSVANDASAAAIVRAILDLAGALKMDTTAEGVEDSDQLNTLRAQGCGSIQGYLYSRPVEPAQAGAMLDHSLAAAVA